MTTTATKLLVAYAIVGVGIGCYASYAVYMWAESRRIEVSITELAARIQEETDRDRWRPAPVVPPFTPLTKTQELEI